MINQIMFRYQNNAFSDTGRMYIVVQMLSGGIIDGIQLLGDSISGKFCL